MECEWDSNKNKLNQQKHLLAFEDAHEVLEGTHLVLEDNRQDYGEKRFVAIGSLRDRIVVLVYTIREDKYRIISMRKANEREQKAYQDRLEGAE